MEKKLRGENIERGWKWSEDKMRSEDDEEDTSDLDEVVNEKNLSEIVDYFETKFRNDDKKLQKFRLLKKHLELLPDNDKYCNVNFFLNFFD